MAFIRDITTTNVIANANNIVPDLPAHVAGDILVLLISKDTTTGGTLSTPAGWTKLGGADELQSTAVRTALYYKQNVSAAETSPTITSTDTDTWSALCVSVGGVATSGVIGANARFNATVGAAHERDLNGITTTQANSLVMWMVGFDGNAQALMGDNARLLNFDDGVGTATVGWARTIPTASATGTMKLYSGGTEQLAGYAIEILDGSSGSDVMPYVEGGINSSNVINTLHGIETNTYAPAGVGSGINQAPVVTSLSGKTISATNTLVDQADGNAMPYARAMRIEADRNATTAFGLTLDVDESGGNAARDMSNADRHIYAIIHHTDKKKWSLGGKAEEFGTTFMLHDTSNNWIAWGVDGRNANRKLASPIAGPVLIHLDSLTNVLGSSGTLNKANVDRFTVAAWAQLANNHYTYVCNIFLAEPLVLLGGSANFPATAETLNEYQQARQDETVLVIAEDDTYLVRWVLQVGNNADTFDANFDNLTMFFPANEIGTHIIDDYFGLIVQGVAGSSISAQNSLWKSKTPFRFDIQNDNGTIDFTGATVSNAETFNIRGDFTNSILTPATGSQVNCFGATLTGAVINGDLVLETPQDLTNVTVNGDLVIDTGSTNTVLSFSGVTVTGDTTNSGTGTLQITATNGSSLTTSEAGTGAGQVDIQALVTLAINVQFKGSSPSDYEWRLYVDDPTQGVIGTVELAGAENETSFTVQYQYNHTGDINTKFQVIADDYVERLVDITLIDANTSVNVDVSVDPNI